MGVIDIAVNPQPLFPRSSASLEDDVDDAATVFSDVSCSVLSQITIVDEPLFDRDAPAYEDFGPCSDYEEIQSKLPDMADRQVKQALQILKWDEIRLKNKIPGSENGNKRRKANSMTP